MRFEEDRRAISAKHPDQRKRLVSQFIKNCEGQDVGTGSDKSLFSKLVKIGWF